ncbi:MAG: hypothetical protein LAT54_00295 [Cryomorphaceae bacterium]|nr:hypothetical protein [Cryomorphaceae bacterium]
MPFTLFSHKTFIVLLFISIVTHLHGQSEALLDIDLSEGAIRVQLTNEVNTFSEVEFELLGVNEIMAHRRQLRQRENVTIIKMGDKWQVDMRQWKDQLHQALDLQYTVSFQTLGSLARKNGDITLNPIKCKKCPSLNPFEIKQFKWSKVFPSNIQRLNLSIRIAEGIEWMSSNDAVFLVEDEARLTINFGVVDLRDFYFTTTQDVLLAVQDEVISKDQTVVQEDKAVEGEQTPVSDAEETIDRPIRRPVLVNLRPIPLVSRPLDKRLNPIISLPFEVEPIESPITSETDLKTLVFQQRFEPPYLGLFHVVDKGLFERIEALKEASEDNLWEIALQQFRMEYGDDEVLVRTLYNYHNGIYTHSEQGKAVFSNAFNAEPFTISVRRNRAKNALELSHTGKGKVDIILNFADGDTIVTVERNTTLRLPKPTPEYYLPVKIDAPVSFTQNDGQAWQLYRERNDALSRYWAMHSLLNSASPHTRATAASFGLDDPLQSIRDMALSASETIPAFASSRLESGLTQFVQDGSYFEATRAANILREKLGKKDVNLPTDPCNASPQWNHAPEDVICDWIHRYPEEKKTVIKEVNAQIERLHLKNEEEDIEALQTLLLIFNRLM